MVGPERGGARVGEGAVAAALLDLDVRRPERDGLGAERPSAPPEPRLAVALLATGLASDSQGVPRRSCCRARHLRRTRATHVPHRVATSRIAPLTERPATRGRSARLLVAVSSHECCHSLGGPAPHGKWLRASDKIAFRPSEITILLAQRCALNAQPTTRPWWRRRGPCPGAYCVTQA